MRPRPSFVARLGISTAWQATDILRRCSDSCLQEITALSPGPCRTSCTLAMFNQDVAQSRLDEENMVRAVSVSSCMRGSSWQCADLGPSTQANVIPDAVAEKVQLDTSVRGSASGIAEWFYHDNAETTALRQDYRILFDNGNTFSAKNVKDEAGYAHLSPIRRGQDNTPPPTASMEPALSTTSTLRSAKKASPVLSRTAGDIVQCAGGTMGRMYIVPGGQGKNG